MKKIIVLYTLSLSMSAIAGGGIDWLYSKDIDWNGKKHPVELTEETQLTWTDDLSGEVITTGSAARAAVDSYQLVYFNSPQSMTHIGAATSPQTICTDATTKLTVQTLGGGDLGSYGNIAISGFRLIYKVFPELTTKQSGTTVACAFPIIYQRKTDTEKKKGTVYITTTRYAKAGAAVLLSTDSIFVDADNKGGWETPKISIQYTHQFSQLYVTNLSDQAVTIESTGGSTILTPRENYEIGNPSANSSYTISQGSFKIKGKESSSGPKKYSLRFTVMQV